ncbi:unnamed protein product [Bathycoccus prasinos]
MTPPSPEEKVQRLPPKLREISLRAIPGYNIFISPSLSLRQYPDRYTFRAGRNLPDKEFRYLRTVIVTAAVHQGFSCQLHPKIDQLL